MQIYGSMERIKSTTTRTTASTVFSPSLSLNIHKYKCVFHRKHMVGFAEERSKANPFAVYWNFGCTFCWPHKGRSFHSINNIRSGMICDSRNKNLCSSHQCIHLLHHRSFVYSVTLAWPKGSIKRGIAICCACVWLWYTRILLIPLFRSQCLQLLESAHKTEAARGGRESLCYALLMIMCLEQKMLTLIYFIMSNNLLETLGWKNNAEEKTRLFAI